MTNRAASTPSVTIAASPARSGPEATKWIAIFAAMYGLFHHQGVLFAPLGEVAYSQTRWADWLDLITPIAVLTPAALALVNLRARPHLWTMFAVGAYAYVEGHGIHLAANSIGNAQPSQLVHLWDEVVGHYILHLGVIVVVAALMVASRSMSSPPMSLVTAVLAGLFGTTWATNALAGGTIPLMLPAALGFVVFARRTGHPLRRPIVFGFGLAVLLLVAHGLWQEEGLSAGRLFDSGA